ncbi:hypothetical protein V1J52_12340 [Streptomyces sp. TRM 70351]|uniref:hypothetical protein n=1 Tax=Streptomyces sp. TRM 70351 TaxID=3116552 RepID=UPI002E7B9B5A|nr:hypothetical protein [Streptomyces sp. TRM 70351]MEE1928955.1 hypothetical protein [Streptomyces sp. TRM 70351]
MALSVSSVLILGIAIFLLTRKSGLKVSHAAVCALFGFYLAGTTMAPGIRAGGDMIASLVSGLNL